VLGKCGARFGIEGSMHWPSRMCICKEREGRGLSCDSGSGPCSMGLLLELADLGLFFFLVKSILLLA